MALLSERLGVNKTTAHPSSRVAQALSRAGVPKTPELLRIVNLPRRKFDVSSYPDASVLYARPGCGNPNCPYCKQTGRPSLRPIQNAIIIEAAQNSGAFVAAGVGSGKTLPSFLLHDALDARRTVLLVQPSLRDKTLNIDLPDLAKHFILPKVMRAEEYKAGNSGVYVLGYSEISQTDASDLLDRIQPDLIIADEVQALKHKKSARTRRFLRFMRKNPCKFVAMTGSPISRSILDFAHLIELCLGKGSPLPADYPSLVSWADCIDNEGKPGATEIGALSLMCEDHESAREGFRRRFQETPGVIATEETSCDLPIEIIEHVLAPPPSVLTALDQLEKTWAWDNEEYTGALDISRLQRQITQGFFYRIKWPAGIKDTRWLQAKNAWSRAIRERLAHQNRVGQDSPALLEAMAEAGQWTPSEWVDWCAEKHKPEPEREPVEISKWLVDVAVDWAKQGPGIIWVSSPVIGKWLESAGIAYYGEGQDKELGVLAYNALMSGGAQVTIACSIQAHGTGKNLQAWWRNLVLYPVSQGGLWEQLIGRTHRPGQSASKVTIDIILGSLAAMNAWSQAQEDAKMIEQTSGLKQRLNIAEIRGENAL